MHAHKHINLGILLAFSAAVIFGTHPNTTRLAFTDGANASFAFILASIIRALITALCAFSKRVKLFPTHKTIKQSMVGGFVQALSSAIIVLSFTYIPGPVAIIILFSHTLMLLLFMAWKKEIALTKITLMSTILALFGLCLVVNLFSLSTSTLSPIGLILAFISAVLVAFRAYTYQLQLVGRPSSAVAAETMLFAAIFSLFIMFFQKPVMPEHWQGFAAICSAGLALGIGTVLMFWGISLMGTFQWSLFLKAEPIFTAIFAYVILNETLSISQYFGMAIVIASLISYQIGTHRKNRKKSIHPTTQLK